MNPAEPDIAGREEVSVRDGIHHVGQIRLEPQPFVQFDRGQIVALDTPAALKAQVGKDRVEIRTDDDEAARLAIREKFGIESRVLDGVLTFSVADGERFVPQLFEMGMAIRAVSVARPSLDDVFMAHTGTSIRDADQAVARGSGPPPQLAGRR